jgi:hypothetical protein
MTRITLFTRRPRNADTENAPGFEERREINGGHKPAEIALSAVISVLGA